MEGVMQTLHREVREVRTYITQLTSVREACVARGEYLAAQACLDRAKEANVRFARFVQSRAAAWHRGERQRLHERQRLESLEDKRSRRERISAYDADGAQLLLRTDRAQLSALRDEDVALTAAAAPSAGMDAGGGALAVPATEVAQLRAALDDLVRAQRYVEAARVRREVEVAERKYTTLCAREGARQREQRLADLAAKLCAERADTVDRIAHGRAVLLRELNERTGALRQRHRAEAVALEAATARVRGVTLAMLAEQLASDTSDPARRGVVVSGLVAATVAPKLHDDEHRE